MRLARASIWNDSAVAKRPHTRPPGNRERFVNDDSPSIETTRVVVNQWMRRRTGRPHDKPARYVATIVECHHKLIDPRDLRVRDDFDTACGQLLLRIRPESLAKLREDHRAGVHKDGAD